MAGLWMGGSCSARHYNAHTSDGANLGGPTFRLPLEEQNRGVPSGKLTLWGVIGIAALETCEDVDTEQRVKLDRLFRFSKDTLVCST